MTARGEAEAGGGARPNAAATRPALRTTLRGWWQQARARSLVLRHRGTDHVRLPLPVVVVLTLLLAVWSWPVFLLAVVVAAIAQVEVVVQREIRG